MLSLPLFKEMHFYLKRAFGGIMGTLAFDLQSLIFRVFRVYCQRRTRGKREESVRDEWEDIAKGEREESVN